MSAVPGRERLSVPESLKHQLREFRLRVWSTQILAALVFAVVGLLLAFVTVFALDRITDTPRPLRWAVLWAVFAASLAIPWAFYRWVWCHRRWDQLARLLRVRQPSVGDQLLSVIELAENDYEQARSRTLCAAAFAQVAKAALGHDLKIAAPRSRLVLWTTLGTSVGILVIALGYFAPEAARNAWARMTAPWSNTPRYTFASIEPIPPQMVIAHGERATLPVRLHEASRWEPVSASLEVPGLPLIEASLEQRGYRLEIPPQTETTTARLRVGDFYQSIVLVPQLRPELVAVRAEIHLPDYLQLPKPLQRDVRSGALSIVAGSSARVQAAASRPLQAASVNGQAVSVSGAEFSSDPITVSNEAASVQLAWRDRDGLAGLEPFVLSVQPIEDERPSIASQQLPRQAVLLESEQVNFAALAADDFGVQRIGMAWRGLDDSLRDQPASGERLIAAGAPDQSSLESPAVFSAQALGIKPQPIEVRLWVEDYLPGRERVYSPPHTFFILTADEHAIWITEQLSKWQRESLEVRDREMALHESNKRLRAMTPEELADDAMRKALQAQAAAEANNGRRLAGLSKQGEELLRQAARNPEIGVGHLDRWAEMLEVIHDIATNRMPSVSDLLAQASSEQRSSSVRNGPATPPRPSVGKASAETGASGNPPDEVSEPSKLTVPQIVDTESSQQSPEDQAAPEQKPKKKKAGQYLGLPQTTLAGPAPKADDKEEEQSDEEPEDESSFGKALWEQEELLAEFQRVADELNTVLGNLEASTLVKRLKAASREQIQVADCIGDRIDDFFGHAPARGEDDPLIKTLAEVEEAGSQKVSYIMDDMQSYFERRRLNQFKAVLDEMQQSDVVGALREIAEKLPSEQGLSIAQTEYWADTLDRWAEDLVDPACSGSCPGSKNSDALPPSVILEVLRILEGEVNLREATRVAEQAKAASGEAEHGREADRLGNVQDELRVRTEKVVESIEALPEGNARFASDIALLNHVGGVMLDARDLLMAQDTGSPAIAAETEAIELLLQCKRINPKGGGGGGASPGGGGTGDTQDSALALLGSGLNPDEKREVRDVSQATGQNGRMLPEEFRAGLDEYFNRLESGQ